MRRFCGVLAAISFILFLGVVGGIEQGRITFGFGFVLMLILLLVFGVCCFFGGLFYDA